MVSCFDMTQSAYTLSCLDSAEDAFSFSSGVPAHTRELLRSVRESQNTTDATDGIKLALWVVAPVLAGFAGWLASHIRAHNALPLGVMREGRFLCRLMRSFGFEAQEFALNRYFALLAAYGSGDDEAMLNWLVRTRTAPLSHAGLKQAFPLYDHPASADIIDLEAARHLVATWRMMGEASPVYALAQQAASDVLRHWHKTIAQDKPRAVALMDFACAGNIQRSLQTLLRRHGDTTPLLGLNFLTTPGTRWAKETGCTLRGFLAEDGQPEWISAAYARTPELAEIFVAASLGPLTGYRADGSPKWGPSLLDATARQRSITDWQDQILVAAKLYWEAMGAALSPELCRFLWGRFLLQPLPEEISVLADWPLDAGLDLQAQRTLAPILNKGTPESWTKMDAAWPAASLLRSTVQKA